MLRTISNFLTGYALGFHYERTQFEEEATLRGGSHYFTASLQISQLLQLNDLIQILPLNARRVQVWSGRLTLLSIPLYLYLAYRRENHDQNLRRKITTPRPYFIDFIVERTGTVVRICWVAMGIFTTLKIDRFLGTGILMGMAIKWTPQYLSTVLSAFSVVSTITLLGKGNVLIRARNFFYIFSFFCSLKGLSLSQMGQKKVDGWLHNIIDLGPTLTEIERPCWEKRILNYEQILEILDGRSSQYEIDPAHCSKETFDPKNFPTCHNFGKLLELFDQIDWGKKYQCILLKLKSDRRFLTFLNRENIDADLEKSIEILASRKGITKEKYVIQWTREQLELLVNGLSRKIPVPGEKHELEKSIENCSYILPYLSHLKDPIELEDTLLELAIEGGFYCTQGIKMTTDLLLDRVIQAGSNLSTPAEIYEFKLKRLLQRARFIILANFYKDFFPMGHESLRDLHLFSLLIVYLGYGFIPLKCDIGKNLFHLLIWELCGIYRSLIFFLYYKILDDLVKENGVQPFWDYFRTELLKDLTPTQKEHIEEICMTNNHGAWPPDETRHRFYRLMLVSLRIIREKTCS